MVHHPLVVALGLSLLVVVAACGRSPESEPVGFPEPGPPLPSGVSSWTSTGSPEVWDAESIYDYIDGHAEVYLAYGMQDCRSQRYAGPEGEADIVLDLFEMASASDAFGVFTHDRDGEEVVVGQGGLYRWGWLSFWQGPFFVSITAEDETASSKAAVLELGRQVAASIHETGEPPALLAALPPDGLEPRSVRYLHHPLILAAHVPVGLDDPYELGGGSPAVLGRYGEGALAAWMLVVDYPDVETATRVVAARGQGPTEGPRGFAASRVLDAGRAVFVLDAGSPELAARLVDVAEEMARGGGE